MGLGDPLPLQLVNYFFRLVQKGHLPNQEELSKVCRTIFSESFQCPSLEAVVNAVNKHGDSAFLVAARYGHVDILRRLHRNYGISLEYCNTDGKTALHEAAQNCQAEAVDFLVGEGAKVDALKRADW